MERLLRASKLEDMQFIRGSIFMMDYIATGGLQEEAKSLLGIKDEEVPTVTDYMRREEDA